MTKIYKFLLIFFSIINLAKVKFLGVNKANYFIINNKNLIDRRSLYFFNLKDCKQTFNLVRISNLNFKIFQNILKIPNFFCYSMIKELFVTRFHYQDFEKLIFIIFSYLKIKKLLLIDDKREMIFFSKLSKKYNVNTLIYMHGRFSRTSKILKKTFFNNYLVWSTFFLNELKKANSQYNDQNVKVVGNPFLNNKEIKNVYKKKIKIKNCLILDEDFIDFANVKIYFKKIKEMKNIHFFIKKKITRNLPKEYLDFCKKNNIKILNSKTNLSITIKKNKIDSIIAATSTGLLEGIFYNIIPIKIYSGNDERENEFKEFVKLGIVYNANNSKSFSKLLSQKYSIETLKKNKKKLWGNPLFQKKKVKKLVKDFLN